MRKGQIKAGQINSFLKEYFGEEKFIKHFSTNYGEHTLENIDPNLPLAWEEYIPGESINFFDMKSDEDWPRKFQAAFSRFPGKDYGEIHVEQISFNVDWEPELLKQELQDEYHFENDEIFTGQRILVYIYGAMRFANVKISIQEIGKDFRDGKIALFEKQNIFAIYAKQPNQLFVFRKAGEMMLLENEKNDTDCAVCTFLICERLKTI